MTLRLRIDGEPAATAPAAIPFAARAQGITGSLIDSSIALLQRQTRPVISFAMGSPAADAIPTVAIAAIAATILSDAKAEALNYGPTEGEASLRQALLAF